MKSKISIPLLLSSLFLVNCAPKSETITFKDYIEIVTNATENEQNIFLFTQSTCANCHKIRPLLNKYLAANGDVNLYELSLDTTLSKVDDTKYIFKDETMGYFTGDSTNDCIKALDNRISLYADDFNLDINNDEFELYAPISDETSKYRFIYTPLIIFYSGQSEVKIVNNLSSLLTKNSKGDYEYDSFVQALEFPSEITKWDKPFDLEYYTKKTF